MGKFPEEYEKIIRSSKETELVFFEELIFDETSVFILEKMEEKGITKAELSKKLGVSRSAITQLLNGSRNLTLKSIIEIMFHLDLKLKIDAEPLTLNTEKSSKETQFIDMGIDIPYNLFMNNIFRVPSPQSIHSITWINCISNLNSAQGFTDVSLINSFGNFSVVQDIPETKHKDKDEHQDKCKVLRPAA